MKHVFHPSPWLPDDARAYLHYQAVPLSLLLTLPHEGDTKDVFSTNVGQLLEPEDRGGLRDGGQQGQPGR